MKDIRDIPVMFGLMTSLATNATQVVSYQQGTSTVIAVLSYSENLEFSLRNKKRDLQPVVICRDCSNQPF